MRNRTGKEILLIGSSESLVFNSLASASKFLGIATTTVTEYIKKNKQRKGYYIDYLLEEK